MAANAMGAGVPRLIPHRRKGRYIVQRGHVLVLLAVLATMALAVVGYAQQERTKTFYLTLSTVVDMPMKIPGMPDLGNVPGLPSIPGLPALGEAGKPRREITGRAVYPTKAVEPIFVTVPGDLKLPQDRLVLEVPKPVTATGGEEGDEEPETVPKGRMVLTTKLYWHPEIARGPITDNFDSAQMPEPEGAMGGMAMPDLERISLAPEPEAYGQESKLPENVIGQGDYVLNTGGTAVMSGFLPPLKVTAPDDFSEVVPAEGFTLEWEPVAGARGYIVHVNGQKMEMAGQNDMRMDMTCWVSTRDEPPMRVRYGYRQETTISDDLEACILLPGDATSCIVPPKVFGDEDILRISVTAVGNDFYSTEDDITVFGTIRSEWSTVLMQMAMGDFEE